MSVLADFFVAKKSEAAAYDDEQACAEEDRVQSSGLTPLELSMLLAALEGREWDGGELHLFEQILLVDGGERIIHQVAPALVEHLAGLDAAGVRRAAEAWAKFEDMRSDADNLESVVAELADLARRAQSTQRGMFVWNCV